MLASYADVRHKNHHVAIPVKSAKPHPLYDAPAQKRLIRQIISCLAGFTWTWAAAVLATRHHLVGTYRVIHGAPPFWGVVGMPVPLLLLILILGTFLTLLTLQYARTYSGRFPRAVGWLLAVAAIPLLDLLRLLEFRIPLTFIEPLALTGVTAWAVGEMAQSVPIPPRVKGKLTSTRWPLVVWGIALSAGVWWYLQAVHAYDNFLLGFNDFGHFGQRVANTWAGRGFLMETPGLPPFWDHFNPGLALLAPLWGLWPDPRLFMLLQAICLLLPAPVIYAIARHWKATSLEAAMWVAAWFLYPPVNQLNLSYSYGWHPVSLALPLLFLAVLLLLNDKRRLALAAVVLACSFREDVVVIVGCLAAAMAVRTAWMKWKSSQNDPPVDSTAELAERLPVWTWIAINAAAIAGFLLIYEFAGLRRFQVSRFEELGESTLEIIASPVLQPDVFWGNVLEPESAYFLAALLVPLGASSLFRGRWILLAAALPAIVLLAWGHRPATSIAFQYTTTLIPVLFAAAMAGAAKNGNSTRQSGEDGRRWRATVTALAGCAVASLWLGSTPWCRNTLTEVVGKTYAVGGLEQLGDRLPGTRGIQALHGVVASVDRETASVLATGRIAAHFVGARRVDTVGQAPQRWAAFEEEAGADRAAIELFDWVVIDTYEQFQQSPRQVRFVLDAAERADYRMHHSGRGILVLRRPDNPHPPED